MTASKEERHLWIRHSFGLGIPFLALHLLFSELDLLLLLDKRAAAAAARHQQICDAVALEVVLAADVGALHDHGNPVEAHTH